MCSDVDPIDSVLTPLPAAPTRAHGIQEILREAIVRGELEPGSLYSVQKIASQLGVSRTPVREALLGLAKEGLVRFERNRGVRILEESARDVDEVFELREWLEVPAARQAAKRACEEDLLALRSALEAMTRAADSGDIAEMWRRDGDFHDALLQASGNRRGAKYVSELRAHMLRINRTSLGRGRTAEEIVAAHRQIVECVESGSGDQAARHMRDYLRETRGIIAARVQANRRADG